MARKARKRPGHKGLSGADDSDLDAYDVATPYAPPAVEYAPVSIPALDALDPAAQDQVTSAIAAGIANGMNPNALVSELSDILNASQALTILRTEMLGAFRQSAIDSYNTNADVVGSWMWVATLSPNTCIACLETDGQIFSLDENFDSHPNCRCTPVPVTVPWSGILGPLGINYADLAATDIASQDFLSGAAWFLTQDAATQVGILGPSAYNAWQAGEIQLADLAARDAAGQLYQASLDELGIDWRDFRDSQMIDLTEPATAEMAEPPVPASTYELTDAEQALLAAQERVDDLKADWESQAERLGSSRIVAANEAQEALWDLARAQAAVDAERGGRGAIIFAQSYSDPFAALDKLYAQSEQIFGRQLTRDELGGLVGAPRGAHVEFRGLDIIGDEKPSWIITLRGPSWNPLDQMSEFTTSEYGATRYLLPTGRGNNYFMDNSGFMIKSEFQRAGLGAQIFSDEAHTLSDLGVKYIQTNAAGEGSGIIGEIDKEASNGFYTWPRFGYLGHLPDDSRGLIADAIERGEVPTAWGKYTTIQQLMRTPEGRDWWKAFGHELDGLRFDLKQGSLSMRMLDAYRAETQDTIAYATSIALGNLGYPMSATYDLTEADRAFVADVKQQIAGLDQAAMAHTDAIAVGQQMHERIEADLTDLKSYAEEEQVIRNLAPNLTDAQRAWAMGNPDAIAAHGGMRWTEAGARYQAEYQARVAAYLSEVRDLGGVPIAAPATLTDGVIIDALKGANEVIPNDWVQASNDLGPMEFTKSRGRSYGGFFQGQMDGSGEIAIVYTRDSNPIDTQSTALHEMMHRMEQAVPRIAELEQQFYEARTAGDAFVDLTNGIRQKTKLDEWMDEYIGREPLGTLRPAYTYINAAGDAIESYMINSYEILSIGAEAALGGTNTYDLVQIRQDRQFMSFVLGLLASIQAGG